MTEPSISQRDVAALAALCHDARQALGIQPGWDEPGIAVAIRRSGYVPLHALAIAFLRAATDPHNDTPVAVLHANNRAWDDTFPWRCPTHPDYRARRVNGDCGACYADRHGTDEPLPIRDRGGKPPGDDIRARLRGATG